MRVSESALGSAMWPPSEFPCLRSIALAGGELGARGAAHPSARDAGPRAGIRLSNGRVLPHSDAPDGGSQPPKPRSRGGRVVIARDRLSADEGARFLAQAGDALAGSLDWEETLVLVAQLAVPTLADWCVVDVLEDDGETRRRYPPTVDSLQPAARALQSGEPAVFPEFDQALLRGTAQDDGHFELLRQLDPRAAVAVPLVARKRIIGSLTLAMSESARSYGEAELALAVGLAGRAALAIDNV